MIRRVGAWVRRQWEIATDPTAAAESEALVASLKASAAKAGLAPGVDHFTTGKTTSTVTNIVTVVEVAGLLLIVVAGALSLAGMDPRGWTT